MTIELTTAPFLGDNIPAYLIDDTIYYIWENIDWDTIKYIGIEHIRYVNPHNLIISTTRPSVDNYYTCISWEGLMQRLRPEDWDLSEV